ncbi:hypothetical protein Tco_0743889 [Tanacetum coccineum]
MRKRAATKAEAPMTPITTPAIVHGSLDQRSISPVFNPQFTRVGIGAGIGQVRVMSIGRSAIETDVELKGKEQYSPGVNTRSNLQVQGRKSWCPVSSRGSIISLAEVLSRMVHSASKKGLLQGPVQDKRVLISQSL